MDLCLQRALQKSDLQINGLDGFVLHTMSRDETVTSWRWNNGSQEFSASPVCVCVCVFMVLFALVKYKSVRSQTAASNKTDPFKVFCAPGLGEEKRNKFEILQHIQ